MTVLLIAVGGAVGGPARYLTDHYLRARFTTALPVGTLVVNVVGSFVLGLVSAGAGSIDSSVAAGLGVGFCGALTTYSTFGYETLRLAESGRTRTAVLNVAVGVLGGLGATALGWSLGSAIW